MQRSWLLEVSLGLDGIEGAMDKGDRKTLLRAARSGCHEPRECVENAVRGDSCKVRLYWK